MARRMRVVAPGERPDEPKVMSVEDAAATGDELTLLVAMRARISMTVSDAECPPRDLAALTRRLQDISERIAAIKLRRKQEGDEGANLSGDVEFSASSL